MVTASHLEIENDHEKDTRNSSLAPSLFVSPNDNANNSSNDHYLNHGKSSNPS